MANRKIVLTGRAGFILSYIAERYATMGDDVLIFDGIAHDKLPDYEKKV